jgi:hypothetical protein
MSAIHFCAASAAAAGGAPLPGVSLLNQNIAASRLIFNPPVTATAAYILTNDGKAQSFVNNPNGTIPPATDVNTTDWWEAKPVTGIGSDYQVRATLQSSSGIGNLTGTLDTWTTITASLVWQLQVTSSVPAELNNRQLLIEIRDVSTQTVQDSAIINLTASIVI